MTPEQLAQFEELKQSVEEIKSMLDVTTMPYEMKELIRNQVVKNEDSLETLTQVYNTSGGQTVTATKAYAGSLVITWKGKEYRVPYL